MNSSKIHFCKKWNKFKFPDRPAITELAGRDNYFKNVLGAGQE